MKQVHRFTAIAILSVFAVSSCKKKEETVLTEDYKGVIVINEGAFGKSNGSLGLYKAGSNEYKDDITKNANGVPLGETVQSVTKVNSNYYVTVTGSQKIDVFGSDFKLQKSITSVSSPRFMFPISDTKMYVTSIYDNSLSILNPKDNTVSGTKIPVPSGTEKLVADSGKAFVIAGYGKRFVYVINTATDQLTDSIDVGPNPAGIVEADGRIFVLSTGDAAKSVKGRISTIGIGSSKLIDSFELSGSYYGGNLVYSGGYLFASLGGADMYRFTTAATNLPSAYITAPGSIYGFNIDPSNGEIYIADAGDFAQQGKIYRYSAGGTLMQTVKAGIVPNGFFFNW